MFALHRIVPSGCVCWFMFITAAIVAAQGVPSISLPAVVCNSSGFTALIVSDAVTLSLRTGSLYLNTVQGAAPLALAFVNSTTGIDNFGEFSRLACSWRIEGTAVVVLVTEVTVYTIRTDIAVFTQRFPAGLDNPSTNDPNGVCTAFPSLLMDNAKLGFVHFSGFMGGDYPQYGIFTPDGGQALAGGMENSGLLVLYDKAQELSVAISPLTEFMAASMEVVTEGGSNVLRWGVMGNATEIPAGFSASWVMVATAGGVTRAVRRWGKAMLQYYNKDIDNAHSRDLTLQYLGYSTDNGAFYYYYHGNYSNYQTLISAVKNYSVEVGLPYRYVQLDSWWYYQGLFSAVTNWTAMPSVFPGGMKAVHEETQWPIQAHNRYWAINNVYASNPVVPIGPTNYTGPTFPFTWGTEGGLPHTYDFWDHLFTINSDWGLAVYEQDWLSTVTDDVPALQNNVTFGRDWLIHMGTAADAHGLSIQYCMSYPRHVLTSLALNSVTQARASNDYLPQSVGFDQTQWNTAESGLWLTAIGIAPSKDNFWSMPVPQYDPHYNLVADTYETRNRLESLSSTLSLGPVQPSDRIGYSNVSLIMRCCNADGLLLRPSMPATPLDRSFVQRAFGNGGPGGNVHLTYSSAQGDETALTYVYLLNANLEAPFNVTWSDLSLYFGGDTGRLPSAYLCYEANSTKSFITFSPTKPLPLASATTDWSFQYFTCAPIFPGISEGWYVAGETSKWIAASQQRFQSIAFSSDGSASATVKGAVGEAVTLTFVRHRDGAVAQVTCAIGETMQARASITVDGTMSCM